MDESILATIKRMLGLDPEYIPFDTEITVHINSVLMVLKQIGAVKKSFTVTSFNDTWSDAIVNVDDIEGIKTYVFLRVKMLFDPPSSGTVMEAMKANASELEWRMNIACD